jgi:glucan phosphorylase
VTELIRTLIDEHEMGWNEAWEITQATCGYTNHTLMPEAHERWPVDRFECVLPRHLQILHEINHRFLGQVAARWPGEQYRLEQLSLIEEGSAILACTDVRVDPRAMFDVQAFRYKSYVVLALPLRVA